MIKSFSIPGKIVARAFITGSILSNTFFLRCLIDVVTPLAWDNHWQGFLLLTGLPLAMGTLLVCVFALEFESALLVLVLLLLLLLMQDVYFMRYDTPSGMRDVLSGYLCRRRHIF
ncbi:hypothetical protein [Silvimonas amylolytica]|uniref:Uncharacterized protein n=1 Tax=Silvimonas amylolytica TaxID=449663 RepID=A0ABQ2PIA4_9NEIS|nr:hypothetical protein [Silvimonas amylolytica]GGP25060.1 hypothetical protein GCM10010971_08790 [Silvimonas amylolytica]